MRNLDDRVRILNIKIETDQTRIAGDLWRRFRLGDLSRIEEATQIDLKLVSNAIAQDQVIANRNKNLPSEI